MKKALQSIMALLVVAGCSKLDMITGEIADGIGVGLSSNGVTVMCKDLLIGAKFYSVKLEKEFEVVDNDLLRQRVSEGADLSCLCTSNVTDMYNLFEAELKEIVIDNKTEFIVDRNGQALYNIDSDLTSWDISSVTDASFLFALQKSFNQDISLWNTESLENMNQMFTNAEIFNQDISNWDTSNVKIMSGVFKRAFQFNQPVGQWNVSQVTTMRLMFYQNAFFDQPLKEWNVSSVNNMRGLFIGILLRQ